MSMFEMKNDSKLALLRQRGRDALSTLRKDERGNILIMAAFMLPVMVGGMALGAESSYWYQQQRKINHASDVSAHAAGVRYAYKDPAPVYEAVAAFIAGEADWDSAIGTIAVNMPPTLGAYTSGVGPNGYDVLEVILTENKSRMFSAMYASGDMTLTSRSVVEIQPPRSACVLSLHPSAAAATSVAGNSRVTLTGCDVAANSSAPDAFSQVGSGTLSTDCIFTVGQAVTTTNLTLADCPAPKENQAMIPDPYRYVVQPTVEGPCMNWNVVSRVTTIVPSYPHSSGVPSIRFCGPNVSFKETFTFMPGLYIMDGVNFTANSAGVVTGSDLTIFLTNSARLRINGQGSFNLAPRASDPWSGILFFGDRTDIGADHRMNGGSNSVYQGAIYLPVADLLYTGNSATTAGCTQVIASTVGFSGNSGFEADCSASGTRDIVVQASVKLVE